MIRRISAAAFALLLAMPLAAQTPAGLQMRVDQSTDAADPDDVPEVTVTAMGSGFQVRTGPAAVLWNPANTATGNYTLSGTFTLQEPSNHVNYYGLVFGGGDLASAGQHYYYFLVAQNGSYILNHRASSETVTRIVPRTPHDAVAPHEGTPSVNRLEVRVGSDQVDFVVNGQVIHSAPKSEMPGTDGIWGVRINHVLPAVLVEDVGVSQ